MRAYPHKPDQNGVKDNLEAAQAMLRDPPGAASKAIAANNPRFFSIRAAQAQKAAACLYALAEPDDEARALLAQGAGDWARALSLGGKPGPHQFGGALGMALAAGERDATAQLAALERPAYTNPAFKMPETLYSLADLMAELARDGARIDDRGRELARVAAADPAGSLPRIQDLLTPLALAVAARDAGAVKDAVARHGALYGKMFRKASERETPEALLDVWGLGFLAVAARQGLRPIPDDSIYLPPSLLGAAG